MLIKSTRVEKLNSTSKGKEEEEGEGNERRKKARIRREHSIFKDIQELIDCWVEEEVEGVTRWGNVLEGELSLLIDILP